jgi:hypothetical protein
LPFPLRKGRKVMTSRQLPQKRSADIQHRIATSEGYPRCVVLDCERPTAARELSGLNRSYCKNHVEHYKRHGSYSKASYRAAKLKPHHAKALKWLKAHESSADVQEGLDRTRTLLFRGLPVEAFRLAGMSPQDRARVVWARLRMHGVEASHVLASWLAIELCHAADPQPERKRYFRWVQAGKVLHRLSGGSHKRWESERSNGEVSVTELHKYPVSRGRVLVHLGEALAKAAKPLEPRIDEIAAITTGKLPARLPSPKRRSPR